VKPLNVPKGSRVLLGSPAKPMPSEVSTAIARAVAAVSGISEAHLPQCFVPGVMAAPAQILAITTTAGSATDVVLSGLEKALSLNLPAGHQLDVWPLAPNSEVLADVRAAGCQIFSATQPATGAQKRPWWRFWGAA